MDDYKNNLVAGGGIQICCKSLIMPILKKEVDYE
jgi:hypothetical protein